jgi:hypothetical protein
MRVHQIYFPVAKRAKRADKANIGRKKCIIPWGLLGREVITRPCSTLSHIGHKRETTGIEMAIEQTLTGHKQRK